MSEPRQTPGFRIGGLGEIALRCSDIDVMAAFYRDTLGLEPLKDGHRTGIRFFRIAEGVAGHTTVLALFQEPVTTRGALHHLALSLTLADQTAAKAWFDDLNLPWREQTFDWIGWRGVFVNDPEGNTVELVAFDPALAPG